MSHDPFLTIFTPTYNRAYILPQLYESLRRQDSSDFVWMIIDDGSSDETEHLVQKWIDEHLLSIVYHKQENGGKQRAHNKAVSLAVTECFLCVDSDDFLTDDAVRTLKQAWDMVRDHQRVSGVIAMKGYDANTPMSSALPKGIEFSPLTKLYQRYGFSGETVLMYRTALLKQYPYDVADGEKFISESYVYVQIDRLYTMYIVPKILNICGYQEDGYTKNIYKIIVRNPISYMRLKKMSMDLSSSPKYKMYSAINLLSAYFILKRRHKNFQWSIYTLLAYLPGYFLYRIRFSKQVKNPT